MQKKDFGLLVLILVVGAVVAMINPRFLSPINLANTANLVGLFGLFAIGQGFVIITGGIELSVGSVIALLGVLFVDLIANFGVPWPAAAVLMLALGVLIGLAHGLLITRLDMQPFIVTLCGLLIYRGIARFYTADGTVGFAFGQSFPWLEWLTIGRTGGRAAFLHRHAGGRRGDVGGAAPLGLRALPLRGRQERGGGPLRRRPDRAVIVAAYVICAVLTALAAIYFAMYTRSISPSSHGNFYELYAIAAAVLGGFCLRGGEGSIIGVVLGAVLLQVLQNLVNLLGIPSSLNFAVMGSVILIGVLADQQFANYRQRRAASIVGQGHPAAGK